MRQIYKSQKRRKSHMLTPRAFTLIEVLVVVAIIALLVAILIPSLADARRQAQVAACASNLRTIGQALVYYAQANNDYLPPAGAGGFENLHIYIQKVGKSAKQLNINQSSNSGKPFADVDWYLCPGDEIHHLTNQVFHKMPDGTWMELQYRLSYSMNGKVSIDTSRKRIPVWKVVNEDGKKEEGTISPTRKLPTIKRPSDIVSYYGAGDDDHGGWGTWCLNESNQYYNQTEFEVHHKKGNNFLYCDTHVSFRKIFMSPPQYGLPLWPWAWVPNYKRGTNAKWDDWVRDAPVSYIKGPRPWNY
ncbi:MAG: type II secretion system protein [Planctomycetota bacterium]|jgi:prepilin-type N-terminal cleavage/methylation domain-containing protein/prepilin-type processing-associated H-X9-DG protein